MHQCRASSAKQMLSMTEPNVSACVQQLKEFVDEIGPDLNFFVQYPHFPGFFEGTTPLYIHLEFLYFPHKRRIRRQFQLKAVNVVTQATYSDWVGKLGIPEPEIRSSWWEATYATSNQLVQRDQQGRPPNRLKRPGIKFLFSASDPRRPSNVITRPLLAIFQRWTISSQDYRNTDLDLLDGLSTLLGKERPSEAESIVRESLAFAANPRWVARAVEVSALEYAGSEAEKMAQRPAHREDQAQIAKGLSDLGMDQNDATALWYYTAWFTWRNVQFEED
ncbi:hypothetical protein P7C70_g6468, partial [Phenoliferia sp. Uapishka_3]